MLLLLLLLLLLMFLARAQAKARNAGEVPWLLVRSSSLVPWPPSAGVRRAPIYSLYSSPWSPGTGCSYCRRAPSTAPLADPRAPWATWAPFHPPFIVLLSPFPSPPLPLQDQRRTETRSVSPSFPPSSFEALPMRGRDKASSAGAPSRLRAPARRKPERRLPSRSPERAEEPEAKRAKTKKQIQAQIAT